MEKDRFVELVGAELPAIIDFAVRRLLQHYPFCSAHKNEVKIGIESWLWAREPYKKWADDRTKWHVINTLTASFRYRAKEVCFEADMVKTSKKEQLAHSEFMGKRDVLLDAELREDAIEDKRRKTVKPPDDCEQVVKPMGQRFDRDLNLSIEKELMCQEAKISFRKIMKRLLSPREYDLFKCLSEDKLKVECAEEMGVKKARVSQLWSTGKQKLEASEEFFALGQELIDVC